MCLMQQTFSVLYSAAVSAEHASFSPDMRISFINVLADMGMGSTDAHRALESAVRGNLVRILTKLLKGKTRYDGILIETTGLADPAPVAQTFFVDVCPSSQAAPVNYVQKQCSLQSMANNLNAGPDMMATSSRHRAGRPCTRRPDLLRCKSPNRAASEMLIRPACCVQHVFRISAWPSQLSSLDLSALEALMVQVWELQGIFSWLLNAAVLFPHILQILYRCILCGRAICICSFPAPAICFCTAVLAPACCYLSSGQGWASSLLGLSGRMLAGVCHRKGT